MEKELMKFEIRIACALCHKELPAFDENGIIEVHPCEFCIKREVREKLEEIKEKEKK